MLWNKAVFCLEVLIYKRLQMWRHNDVIGCNEYLISTFYASVASICLSAVTLCIVAKRWVLEQKLLLTAYRKSYMRNRLVSKWMILTFI